MKEKLQAFFHKITNRLPRQLAQPMIWCLAAAVLLSALAVTVTISGSERGAADRRSSPADGSSRVMEDDVARLYAVNDAGLALQNVQTPQVAVVDPTVRSGIQTTQNDAVTQTPSLPASASPTAAPAADSADESEEDSMRWNDVTLYLSNAHETTVGSTGRVDYSTTTPQIVTDPDTTATPAPTPGAPPTVTYTVYEGPVSQKVVLFNVAAFDSSGNALGESAVSLVCNHALYKPIYTKSNVMTYALTLTPGSNAVSLTVTDAVGVQTATTETIVYNAPSADTVIVSVEATTVGFGYLVPPTAVTLEGDKPISYYVANLLTQYGYTMKYSGSVEADFYLQSVGKTGAFAKPSIAADLKAKILADSDASFAASFNEASFSPDALSQSNFTRDSGWMYCVNEQYYNVGMSYLTPVAGDVIRVRYTLALGRDIGGGFQGTNWEKQW